MASCDLLISAARVIDGSGGASRFIDVAVDRDRIIDLASFAEPKQLCEGIVSVWVNGTPTWQDHAATGSRRGRFLTHRDY
jgi:N-acyl-D-aspartate/D-glutamate deacylase